MMVTLMKCKQTTDLEHVARLRSLLAEFRVTYLGPETGRWEHGLLGGFDWFRSEKDQGDQDQPRTGHE